MASTKTNENISKEMQDAINNYGSHIKTLGDLVTAVRKLPGMYLGPIHGRGFLNMIREIFQNSIDQMILRESPCNHIYISYNMQTLEVIVEDNGLGFPFNDMVRILTSQHTSKNYEKKKGEYSSGLHGSGAKIVNAMSTSFIAESYRYDGKAVRLTMEEGYPTTKEPVSISNPNFKQGSRVVFVPSVESLGGYVDLDWNTVYRLVKRIVSLTPIGSIVDFEAVDENGKLHQEHIVNEDGIITDLIMKSNAPFIKPIVFSEDTGYMKMDAAIVYSASDTDDKAPDSAADITAFSNFCPTVEQSTHVSGFIKGIESWFVSYMNKIYLNTKNNKTKVIAADIDCGLKVMISAACLEPVFVGQSKDILSNEEMVPFAKSVATNGLESWSKENPQDLNKLCKYFKDIADIRMKSDKEKLKIVDKFEKTFTGYPEKYAKPEGKKNLEFIICEGDSAKGTIMDGRDKKRQGVFPIRGKMPNAFRTSYKKFMENAEVQGINKILLDGPYRRNYDPIKDCKWEKIIFAADADIDGAHIDAILLRYFILYHPQLIEAGKVYKTVPPLFGIDVGKNRTQYFTERIDIVRYIQKEFVKNNEIKDIKGKPIPNKELSSILAMNIDYTYEINRIANTFAVDPYLLEMVLVNELNKKSPAFLKKQIKSQYRFMDTKEINHGEVLIEGVLGDSYNTLFVNDMLINESTEIINILNMNREIYYKVNGKSVSLYGLMSLFEATSPKSIQRYKGLGEMNYHKLAESTIHPEGQRTLVQYTLEDVKDEIESIRIYESNTKLILNEVGKVTRTELLG